MNKQNSNMLNKEDQPHNGSSQEDPKYGVGAIDENILKDPEDKQYVTDCDSALKLKNEAKKREDELSRKAKKNI